MALANTIGAASFAAKHHRRYESLIARMSLLLVLITVSIMIPTRAASVEGYVYSMWGDAISSSQAPQFRSFVLTDAGERIEFASPSDRHRAEIFALNGQRMRITFASSEVGFNNKHQALDIQPAPAKQTKQGETLNSEFDSTNDVQGSRRYVSLLCKFSDKPSEQRPISYFDAMYGDSSGQLGHYWREVSSNAFNLVGSRSYGGTNGSNGWFTMSKPLSSYVNGNNETDLNLLFEDCVSVADPFVDFSQVDGINLMFNDEIGCCAWGGSFRTTLDGVTRNFPTTWEPEWAWRNVAVLAHEIGHSLGLPHSNNSDGDGDPYDSPWTVMSNAFEGFVDGTFGLKGVHLNAHEKDVLGWMAGNEIFTVARNGRTSRVTLRFLDRSSAGGGTYRMAVLNDGGKRRFTIEARQRGGTYEGLPGTAVIIHTIDEDRTEPAWIVDAASPPANFSDTEGVMWRVGESFEDSGYGLNVDIISQNSNGFVVDITAQGSTGGSQNVPVGAISLLLDE